MAITHESSDKQLVHLLVVSGPDKGKMFFIKPGKEALIGRAPAADLRLTDPGSSGRHCVVRSAGDVVFVEDLKSRNGTKVNGEAVDNRVLDEKGTLEIGTSKIEVSWAATGREVPLSAVDSNFSPTLLETATTSMQSVKPETVGGSTIVGADQLVLFRIAQKQLGSVIADHMLLEVIGMGGMGFVFRAKHVPTREEVALKLIPHSTIRTPALLERFLSGCKMGLEIPGAVKLLHHGDSPEHAFVAMKCVRGGRSLQSRIENEAKFFVPEAVRTIASVCKTLEAAHAAGIVHRDIKPANILMLEDGSTALLDLGMGPKHDPEGRSILTRDERLDSVAYMSPEITRQSEPDGRADVYSLAAVLFAILSTHKPFSAKTHIELIRKIRWEGAPVLSQARPDVPEKLSQEVARAMEKDVAARHGNIAEFASAISAAV